jgi:hypothetical protein
MEPPIFFAEKIARAEKARTGCAGRRCDVAPEKMPVEGGKKPRWRYRKNLDKVKKSYTTEKIGSITKSENIHIFQLDISQWDRARKARNR